MFAGLLARAGAADSGLRLDTSANTQGRGIFIDRDVVKGTVLLELPLSMCISVDYAKGGLRLPQDVPGGGPAWPRLTKAVAKDDALPWDVLISLALLDSLSGMGSELFQDWGNTAFPEAKDMSLPVCLPLGMLGELQDDEMVGKALEQKERLRGLFPGLSVAVDADGAGAGGCTWLEYAFGLVRSRAFCLGDNHFAFVPVLDAANHATSEPSADFQLDTRSDSVVFFALKDIKAGEEVTISYTGRSGYTNKRLMTQYGFVFENPFDTFDGDDLDVDLGDVGSASFDVWDVQRALGDSMVEIFSGKDVLAYASLKSLPIDAGDDAAVDAGGDAFGGWSEGQRALLERIRAAVDRRIEAWETGIIEDKSLLAHMLGAKHGSSGGDGRLVACLRYRIARKERDQAMRTLVDRLLGTA